MKHASARKGHVAQTDNPDDDETQALLRSEEGQSELVTVWKVKYPDGVHLSRTADLGSERVGKLTKGEVVVVTQTQALPSGLVRVHCRDRGWITSAPHLIERTDDRKASAAGAFDECCCSVAALRDSATLPRAFKAVAAVLLIWVAAGASHSPDPLPHRLSPLSPDQVPLSGPVSYNEIMALFPASASLSGDLEGTTGRCENLKQELVDIEAEVFCTIGTFTPPDSAVVDGGAHWGETLRLMEASLADTVQIYSVEAIEANVNKIRKFGIAESCEGCASRTHVLAAALTTTPAVDSVTINCLIPIVYTCRRLIDLSLIAGDDLLPQEELHGRARNTLSCGDEAPHRAALEGLSEAGPSGAAAGAHRRRDQADPVRDQLRSRRHGLPDPPDARLPRYKPGRAVCTDVGGGAPEDRSTTGR